MISRPEIQRLAQQELDGVCPDRIVTLADRDKCPYTESVLLEVIRYKPIGTIGVPHCSERDDEFEGKKIPGGSIMVYNI